MFLHVEGESFPVTPRFALGRLVITPGAADALDLVEDSRLAAMLIARHVSGDCGDCDDEDKATNAAAIRYGNRVMSVYKLPGAGTVWIITEAGRHATTILTPDEY